MSRYLAIEWDRHEIRFAVADVRGRRHTVQHLLHALMPEGSNGDWATADEIGVMIRRVLQEHRIAARTATTLIGVGRSSIELRELRVPRVDEDELADVVRQHAMRELSSMSESSRLDFIPLDRGDDESQQVVAAAISNEDFQQVEATCAAAGIKPARIVMRSFASGSLLGENLSGGEGEEVVLLVDPQADDVDLTVLSNRQVIYSRTVRLALGGASQSGEDALLAEIRRTTMAAQNQPQGSPVSAVCLWRGPSSGRLSERISTELSLEVRRVDPLEGWSLGGNLDQEVVADAGRYASLIGAITDELGGAGQPFDFLNPRQPPVEQDRRKLWISIAAAVLLLAGGVGFGAWRQVSALDQQITDLKRQSSDLDRLAKRAAAQQNAAAVIGQWAATDVVWLDELRYLATRFPPPRDAVLLRLSMASSSTGAAGMDLQGLVREPSLVETMENRLRDSRHDVRTKRGQQLAEQGPYAWRFDTSILVQPPAAAESAATKTKKSGKRTSHAARSGSKTAAKRKSTSRRKGTSASKSANTH